MMEAVRTSETSVDNYFARQYMSQKTILNDIHKLCKPPGAVYLTVDTVNYQPQH
jgi:hypothetical protein